MDISKDRVIEFIEKNRENIVNDISEIIAINSVKGDACDGAPYGIGPKMALDKILEIAQRNGLSVTNMDNKIGYAEIKGIKDDYLASITHVDVVPEGNGWKADPFKTRIIDGYLIGRGVGDDKGPAVLTVYMMKFFKELGVELPYTTRAIFGSDEETGSSDVSYYLTQEKPPVFVFSPDADFPVCAGEKGIASFALASKKMLNSNVLQFNAGYAGNVIPDIASITFKKSAGNFPLTESYDIEETESGIKITAHGIGGHAMAPQGKKNAIGMLVKYGLENGLFTEEETPYMQLLDGLHTHYDGSSLGIDSDDGVFEPLTVVGCVMKYADGVFTQSINIRFPTSTSVEKMRAILSEKLRTVGGSVPMGGGSEPFYIGTESQPVQALLGVYNSVMNKTAKPYTIGGGTYARMFPSGAAFGIVFPDSPLPDFVGAEHMAEEGFLIDNLMKALEILILAMAELQKLDF